MAFIKLSKKKTNRVPTTSKREYQDIYQDKRWKKIRADRLRNNPLCQHCESNKKVTTTDEVHHIAPFEWGRDDDERQELAFDYDNTRSLCVECHKEAHRLIIKNNYKQHYYSLIKK